VPGNAELSASDAAERRCAIFDPYHMAIEAELQSRDKAGVDTVLVSLHSFTPTMGPEQRPWEIGVLHDQGDASFAMSVLDVLQTRGDFMIGDNQPYRMDGTDFTVPRHAYGASRRYVEIEVRQDLLGTSGDVARMAQVLTQVLQAALGS
jgi:predicted N-formylglutamate amidohydrolase